MPFRGPPQLPVKPAIVAQPGGGQSLVTFLTWGMTNVVGTVGTIGDSVTLPPATGSGQMIAVSNAGALSMNMFPSFGGNYLGSAANAALAMAANASVLVIDAGVNLYIVR